MGSLSTVRPVATGLSRLTPSLHIALGLLLRAVPPLRVDPSACWDAALDISTLRAVGVTNADVRWLACKGYIEHASEASLLVLRKSAARSALLSFSEATRLHLTRAGTMFASQAGWNPEMILDSYRAGLRAAQACVARAPVPSWDAESRELYLGDLLVKRFKCPAPNQELILSAFEEQAWAVRIDDPLPPEGEVDVRERLHDAIRNLNRHHLQPVLRFQEYAACTGVRWTLI